MKYNIGKTDRVLRVVIGTVLMIAGLALSGTAGIVMAGFGLIPLATGLVGNCPAYSILKINTCGTHKFN